MSGDSFSESTGVNFFQRMGQSVIGALVGVVLFLVSFVVLFWNEGRAVDTARALDEAGGAVVTVANDKVDPANNGKLVQLTGEATTDETLTDNLFGGVSAKAIRLERKVEMYQWEQKEQTETRNKAVGGGQERKTTYTYPKVWSSQRIDSSNFKVAGHENPPMPFASNSITAKVVKLGAFELSPSLVNEIKQSEPLPLPSPHAKDVPNRRERAQTGDAEGSPGASDDSLKVSGAAKDTTWKNVGNVLYSGDPSVPRIGDLKVGFAVVKPQKVSVMAAQSNNTFTPYQPKSAKHPINLLMAGDKTAKEMITAEEESNKEMTWILRLVGFILMGVGIFLVLNPLSTFANIIPFLGGFMSGAVGFVLGVFAFLVAAVLSLITIAIAWLFYRPLLAIGLLAGATVLIVLVVMLVRRSKPAVRAG